MPDRTPTLLLAILAFCACGDRADPPVTELTVDTLADGSIRVTNPAHGLWGANAGSRWRLVEDLRIGTATGDGPDAFGNVISLALDALDRLWIVDSQANEVRVFDRNGRFVRTIGGRGEGPGEFIGARGVGHGPNGEIWVEDGRLKRWEIFDTAGSRIGGQRYVTQVGGEWRLGLFLGHDWIQDSDRYVYRVYRPGATGSLEPDGRVFELPEEPPDPPQIEFTRGGATFSFWAPFSPLSQGSWGRTSTSGGLTGWTRVAAMSFVGSTSKVAGRCTPYYDDTSPLRFRKPHEWPPWRRSWTPCGAVTTQLARRGLRRKRWMWCPGSIRRSRISTCPGTVRYGSAATSGTEWWELKSSTAKAATSGSRRYLTGLPACRCS